MFMEDIIEVDIISDNTSGAEDIYLIAKRKIM
jgi:hypothetical protein